MSRPSKETHDLSSGRTITRQPHGLGGHPDLYVLTNTNDGTTIYLSTYEAEVLAERLVEMLRRGNS